MSEVTYTIPCDIRVVLRPRWWLPVAVVRYQIGGFRPAWLVLWPLPFGEQHGAIHVGSLTIPLRVWWWE